MAHFGVSVENDEFCDEFFPYPSDLGAAERYLRDPVTTNPFIEFEVASSLADDLLEKQAIEFTAAINDNHLAPGLKITRSAVRADTDAFCDDEPQTIDAAFYRTYLTPTDDRPHFDTQLIAIEFLSQATSLDPFSDDDMDNTNTDAEARKKVLGHIITHAELIFATQQRLALFMLAVIGRTCRFIRWDRSGTIVTRALDYVRHWQLFCGILWRISQCSDSQLGIDPTATRLLSDDPDYIRMTDVAIENDSDVDHKERIFEPGEVPTDDFVFKYVRTMFRKSLAPDWPRYKLEVPSGDTVRTFLVCEPVFCAKGMAGRGTRGYVALDCATGRFVWLKDVWRAHHLLTKKEGDILAVLNAARIQNVPTVICHGDIQNQTTKTPDWWERKNPTIPVECIPLSVSPSWEPSVTSSPNALLAPPITSSSCTSAVPTPSRTLKRKRDDEDTDPDIPSPKSIKRDDSAPSFREDCPLRPYRHYRLVEKEVALPLSYFEYGRQLVSIVTDCVFAHFKAATKRNAGLLHRDVSGGNILIFPKVIAVKRGLKLKWSGLLADWEMAKSIHEKDETRRPCRGERIGTWQYMSIALSTRPKSVEISDELEAFLYVLIYYALRYLKSNCDDLTVAHYMYAFFDKYFVLNGQYVCGPQKLAAIRLGALAITDTKNIVFHSPMDNLLGTLLSWFKSHRAVTVYQNKASQPTTQRLEYTNFVPPLDEEELDQERKHDSDTSDSGSSDSDPDSDSESDFDSDSDVEEGPSDMDWKYWKYVQTHKRMIKLLNRYITTMTWGGNDKLGDRILGDYKPPAKLDGPPQAVATSFTRKEEQKGEKVDSTEPLPSLPPPIPVMSVDSESRLMP